jgi:hypothetical protein
MRKVTATPWDRRIAITATLTVAAALVATAEKTYAIFDWPG